MEDILSKQPFQTTAPPKKNNNNNNNKKKKKKKKHNQKQEFGAYDLYFAIPSWQIQKKKELHP